MLYITLLRNGALIIAACAVIGGGTAIAVDSLMGGKAKAQTPKIVKAHWFKPRYSYYKIEDGVYLAFYKFRGRTLRCVEDSFQGSSSLAMSCDWNTFDKEKIK